MPVIRLPDGTISSLDFYVNLLAEEWRGEQVPNAIRPDIIESEIGFSKHLHVVVIWDDWRDLGPQHRSRAILDAYSKSHPGEPPRITIAMGLTREEAAALGYLPYKVEALVKTGEKPTRDEIASAMKAQGAFETKRGLELRFYDLSLAQTVYKRLEREFPGVWVLVKEEPPSE